jgi:hypothetical protein
VMAEFSRVKSSEGRVLISEWYRNFYTAPKYDIKYQISEQYVGLYTAPKFLKGN